MIVGHARVLVLLAVAGCTRGNPAFEAASGSTGDATGTTSNGGDDPVASTRGDADADADATATRGDTSVDPDTLGVMESTEGTTGDSSDSHGNTTDPSTTTATSEPPPETSSTEEGGPLPVCGDGMHDPLLLEQCDDGNMEAKDGCSECMLDNPGACNNAQLDPGEQCDDGGNLPGDGCGLTCQLENPELCGNGIPDSGEQCDDGNMFPDDECGLTCQWPVPVAKPKEPV